MVEVDALKRDARDDPARVRQECRAALESHSLTREHRRDLLHALAWAELELGDLAKALRSATDAKQHALPDDDAAIDIGYLHGVIRIAQGQPELAVDELLDTASTLAADGQSDGKIEMALAIILAEARHSELAYQRFGQALELAKAAKDTRHVRRILNNRAILSMQIGRFAESQDDLDYARYLAAQNEQPDVLAVLDHNQGALYARCGALPQAVACFETARAAMDPRLTHVTGPALTDEAQLLLDGGLLEEARNRAIEAAGLYADGGAPARQIEAIFLAVRACAAGSRFTDAARHAHQAATVAEAASFDASIVRAMGALGNACAMLERPTPEGKASDLGSAGEAGVTRESATGLDVLLRWVPGIVDMAIELGMQALGASANDAARTYFDQALEDPTVASALGDLGRLVASCGLHMLNNEPEHALRKASSGLMQATSNAIALGVTEFRTMASRRLRQLASIGVLAALELGEPARAGYVLEQMRAVELLPEPQLTPPERVLVAQLRRTVAALTAPNLAIQARANLLCEQQLLEDELRSLRRRSSIPPRPRSTPTWSASTGHLGIDLHIVGDRVCVLIGSGADARICWIESALALQRATENTTLALDTSAGDNDGLSPDRFLSRLGDLLRPVLDAIDQASTAFVVLDPRLGQVPWSLLTSTAVAASPSREHYLAGLDRPAKIESVGVVIGSDLRSAQRESDAIAEIYPNAVVLRDAAARTEAVRELLDVVDLIHFAAHGRFRADNPLMSHLAMATGTITFVDLMEQSRVPSRMVFSACNLGAQPSAAAVGLSGLLFSRGCSGFIAAGGPTNDTASAELMIDLHRTLAARPQASLAVALRHAQAHTSSVSMASYLAYGSG